MKDSPIVLGHSILYDSLCEMAEALGCSQEETMAASHPEFKRSTFKQVKHLYLWDG